MRPRNVHWLPALCLVLSFGCGGDKGAAPPPVGGAPEASPAALPKAATSKEAPGAKPSEATTATTSAAAPTPKAPESSNQMRLKEMPNAGKASASDGQSLADAKKMVDTMARELKRSTAAVVMAGKDKDKVDAIGQDFQKLNKTMTREMESISERLTPEELVQFEEYTRVTLSPLINSLLQAFFSAGGLNPSKGPNGTTKLVPQQSAPAAPSPAPQRSVTPTPVASALGAGAMGSPTPKQPALPSPSSAPAPTPAPSGADSLEMTVAKGAVNAMAKELSTIVTRIRAADNDKLKLRQINKDYTAINQKHGARLPEVFKALSASEKEAFNAYVQAKLMPISSALVQAFTEAGVSPAK